MYLIDCVIDENAVGYIEEEGTAEPEDQDPDHFAEQGKLLSELAPQIYASNFDTMIYS